MACGDLLSIDAPHAASKDRSAGAIALLGAMGVDYAVPGNHEFHDGADAFRRRMAQCSFPWLCTNVLGTSDVCRAPFGTGVAWAVRRVRRSRLRVGLLGVCTPDTRSLSHPGESVVFADVVAATRGAVTALRVEGVDALIALTHLRLVEDRALALAVPELDLVVGGHDHEPTCAWPAGAAPIIKAGSDWSHLARITMRLRRGVRPFVAEARLMANDGSVPAIDTDGCRDTERVLQEIESAAATECDRPDALIVLDVALDSRDARTGECSMGWDGPSPTSWPTSTAPTCTSWTADRFAARVSIRGPMRLLTATCALRCRFACVALCVR